MKVFNHASQGRGITQTQIIEPGKSIDIDPKEWALIKEGPVVAHWLAAGDLAVEDAEPKVEKPEPKAEDAEPKVEGATPVEIDTGEDIPQGFTGIRDEKGPYYTLWINGEQVDKVRGKDNAEERLAEIQGD